jgi:hypothetical protein
MKITKTQLKEMVRGAVKKRLNEILLSEQSEQFQSGLQELPVELQIKTKEIADGYLLGQVRWYALESLFFDLVPWALDPMEVVSYVYHELNKASQSDFGQGPSKLQKQKAHRAYDKLVDLAQQERMQTKYDF